KKVLVIPRVGTRDNFFDIGGHSLLAVRAHRELTKAFETRLSITDLFRFPTVQALAQHIGAGDQGDDQSVARDRGQMRRASRARRRSRARSV
ncbi:MAG: hypothetical protein GY769_08345, partial [bacterium]|nr:hypothetical protein [bacterium]